MNVATKEPIRPSTLTRTEVLEQCAASVVACWNHYCEIPFPPGRQYTKSLARNLNNRLPAEFTTTQTKLYRRG